MAEPDLPGRGSDVPPPLTTQLLGPGVDAEIADQLLGYLTGARWFAGKGRRAELATVTPLPWLTAVEEWPAVRSEVVEIAYPVVAEATDDGSVVWPRELYQVLVSYRSAPESSLQHAEIGRWSVGDLGPVVAYDAAQDPAACRVLLRQLLGEGHLVEGDAEVGFHATGVGGLREDLEPSIFRGQQSNTSIMFGDQAMIKVFRRLELGKNLDIAVHDALSRTGVGDVAELYGWIDATWRYADQPVSADLAMAVEKLAQAEEGWALALAALRQNQPFTADAGRLGTALAEIHQALRTAFPTGSQPGSAVATIMKQRLAAAIDIAPALAPYAQGLTACFDRLAEHQLDTQRVHGDFHLGQTLATPGGWKIIDFEGEPVKTLAEREMPDSVWRDIAGMLRSFAYAAASVPGAVHASWATECREAFLTGYAGGQLRAQDAAVLRAYEADKAVYEVVYEVRNRPDWVAIPLAAVAVLADRPDTAAPPDHDDTADPYAASSGYEDSTKE